MVTFLPALHGSDVETQGKCRVRRYARAIYAEPSPRNLLRSRVYGRFDLVLVTLSYATGHWIDESRELDHRVM